MNYKEFLKDNENKILLGLILFSLVIRIYYFNLTMNQTLWWDEAEYMWMAKHIAFGVQYVFDPVRPVLFSIITAFSFMITGYNEIFPRILMVIVSILTVIYTYKLGKLMYNKTVGLISATLMSVAPIVLFFSVRILVDLPSLLFFTISAYYLYKYIKTKENKSLYLGFLIAGIGTLFRLTTAIILFVFLLYIIITEHKNILKKKEYYLSAGIFILTLLPYLIWGYIKFGGLIILKAGAVNAPTSFWSGGLNVLINYIKLFPYYFSWLGTVIFIIGLLTLYRIFKHYKELLSEHENETKKELFLFLLFIVPIIAMSFIINHNEDRYIMTIFTSVFIISALPFEKIKIFLEEKQVKALTLVTIVILITLIVLQLKVADNLINYKLNSYDQVREVGLIIKDKIPEEAIIVTTSLPQIALYSEHETVSIPKTLEELEEITKNRGAYLMISIFEKSPEYSYSYPADKKLPVVYANFMDKEKKQPAAVLYKLS